MARVLVVEPDPQIRRFVAGILSDFGHDVQQCGDAARARQILRCAPFDVVATDVVLDEAGGEIAEAARRLPVLTLSGRLFCSVLDKYRRPARLPEKPFRFADLDKLVAAIGACSQQPEYALAA